MVKKCLFIALLFCTKAFAVDLPSPETTAQHQYQMVIVHYGDQRVSSEVQESLAIDFVTAMGELGLSTLSVDSMKNLQMDFKNFHQQLALALATINDVLPEDQSIPMNMIYLPINKSSLIAKSARLQTVELPRELAMADAAFNVRSLELSMNQGLGDAEFEWYTSISNSLALHNQEMSQKSENPGFFFSALQMQMNLQKDNSSMQLQILVGLNGQSLALNQVNDQVRISSMTVPQFSKILDQNAGVPMAEAPGYFSQVPMAVLSTAFEQSNPEKTLELSVALGAFNGLGGHATDVNVIDELAVAGTARPSEVGPEQWLMECQDRMHSVPALNGSIAKGAVGGGTLGSLLEKANLAIDFHFFNMWFQFNEAGEPYIPPGHLDVRVALAGGLAGFGECIVMGDVNQQLADEANATIKVQLEELLRVDSLAEELLSQF